MKKRVIFVDDEPNILRGLRRMLRSRFKPAEWELAFANSGQEALEMMAEAPFDVVVSDMRMPGMTGADLLNTVMTRYPQTVRFILSGFSDRDLILKSVGCTHQYLSKPCDADELMGAILRAYSIREVLEADRLKKLVSQVKFLPALPEPYLKVMEELKSPDAAPQRVGEIIALDVAMTAKVLQLVNSAFFGLRHRVDSPVQAVSLLGVDVVRSLALMIQVFPEGSGGDLFSPDELWRHSLMVARCAQKISGTVQTGQNAMDDAFMGGLLHDIGVLVLAANLPEQYAEALQLVRDDGVDFLAAERQVFDATHCEVGGYLLGLWGFPDLLIEDALYHHEPVLSSETGFSSLTAVYVANMLANEMAPGVRVAREPEWSMDYLHAVGAGERLDEWRALCQTVLQEGEEDAR